MISHKRFWLVRTTGGQRVLVRSTVPAAPNPDGGAVDFARKLGAVRGESLLRSWLAHTNQPAQWTDLGQVFLVDTEDLEEDLHGQRAVALWAACDPDRDRWIAGRADSEDAFWALAEEERARIERYRRPATLLSAWMLTEADYRMVDAPLAGVDETGWMTGEEITRWCHNSGVDALRERVWPPSPDLTAEEHGAPALARLLAVVDDALAASSWRFAAFELLTLVRTAPAEGWPRVSVLFPAAHTDPDCRWPLERLAELAAEQQRPEAEALAAQLH